MVGRVGLHSADRDEYRPGFTNAAEPRMDIKILLNACHRFPSFVYGKSRRCAADTIQVDLRPRKGSKPICSICGERGPTYDTARAPRFFEFVPLWGFKVFLLYFMRRVDCFGCGTPKVERVPWAEGKQQTCNAYRLFLARWARRMSWSEVARVFRTDWGVVYRAVEWVVDYGEMTRRMHNKAFIVDNRMAIVGGRDIGNDYFGIDTKANFFDLDVLTVGEGAVQAGAAFDEYWNSKKAVPISVLHDNNFTKEELDAARERLNQSLVNLDAVPYAVAMEESATLENMKLWREKLIWTEAMVVVDPLERFDGQGESAIVEFAAHHIADMDDEFIAESAYLIPDPAGIDKMAELVDRGIRLRLLTNSLMSNNHLTAHSGYMKYRKPMLEAGVELHELRADAALREHFKANEDDDEVPAGIHTKAFVIDGEQALIGSFNFDPRSRDLNSEIGLVVTDKVFAAQVEGLKGPL